MTAAISNEIWLAFADAYDPLEPIVALIRHVPTSTKVTKPDEELIVHTDVVELEYDLVPLSSPTDAVDVIVGFVPTLNA